VGSFLSAAIACERCFCVVSPLKARRMLSTRHMAVIIVVVSLVIMAEYMAAIGFKHTTITLFNPVRNITEVVNTVTE
jgi:hypothetical protein